MAKSKQVIDLRDEAIAEQKYDDLLQAFNRKSRELDRIKHQRGDIIDAIYQASKDAHIGFRVEPIDPPPKDKRQKTSEVAAICLSDWQLGKRTPDYNMKVCEQRVRKLAQKVIELTNIQRAHHPVKELRIWCIGDIVESEQIFPGQVHEIEGSVFKQSVTAKKILADFITTMLANFDKVHVVGVIGNHGSLGTRARREFNPNTNWDRVVYDSTRDLFRNEKRVTWVIPEDEERRAWYAVDKVGDKGVLLFHGDQVRGGFAGMPFYGFFKKVLGWGVGAIPEHFDYAIAGHWHTPTFLTLNTKQVWVNGSTESSNPYAQEQLAAVGFPSQQLLFFHPRRGVTAEYKVRL